MVVEDACRVTPGGWDDDPAVVDLLRAMISGTHWTYAEMWVAVTLGSVRRRAIAAAVARPGQSPALQSLERLSRALVLRPDECLLRHAQDCSSSRLQAVDLDDLASSPRAASIQGALIMSSMTICAIDGSPEGPLVVLMSQRGLAPDAGTHAADAAHIEQLSVLCMAAAPYLSQMQRAGDVVDGRSAAVRRASESARVTVPNRVPPMSPVPAQTPLESPEYDFLSTRTPSRLEQEQAQTDKQEEPRTRGTSVTYKSPARRKFNAVREDINVRVKPVYASPAGSKAGAHGSASLAVEYQVAINEALAKVPAQDDGQPHAMRVSILWTIFEQLCEVPSSFNSILACVRRELKPAIFSDELMSSDDGLSLIRVPYFEQIKFHLQRLAESERKCELGQQQMEQLLRDQIELRQRVEEDQELIAKLKRAAALANRRLVKEKLKTFLERKSMQEDLRNGQRAELQALEQQVAHLKQNLKLEVDATRRNFVEDAGNVDIADVLAAPLEVTSTLPPPVKVHLFGSSWRDSTAADAAKAELGMDSEVTQLKEQMLVLRNANLTQHEREGVHAAKLPEDALKDKFGFLSTMNAVESEILALDTMLESGAFDHATSADNYMGMLKQAQEDKRTQKAARLEMDFARGRPDASGTVHASAAKSIGYPRKESHDLRRTSSAGSSASCDRGTSAELDQNQDGDDAPDDALWLRGDNSHDGLDLVNLCCHDSSAPSKERVRELHLDSIMAWVYEILHRKADAELELLLGSDPSLPYPTLRQTFRQYMNDKYGSSRVADLAAYDILSYIDRHRDDNAILNLFSQSMAVLGQGTGDWKYFLRAEQFARAVLTSAAVQHFSNLDHLQDFLLRRFYADQQRSQVDRLMELLQKFAPYNRCLAQSRSKAIPLEVFSEFIAHLIQQGEELRMQKVLMVMQVEQLGTPNSTEPMPYAKFERLAVMCIAGSVEVAACQQCYRLLQRSCPDRIFSATTLSAAIATLELEGMIAGHHNLQK